MASFFRKSVPDPPAQIMIGVSSDGIELHSGSQMPKTITWTSIVRIVAFKRDLFSKDLLCMALELQPQAVFELNEEMGGWSQLTESLSENLPGALKKSKWISNVMFPAFEVSSVQIYQRQSDSVNPAEPTIA